MLRRVIQAIKEAFTPHWEDDDSAAETGLMGAAMIAPTQGAILAAADSKDQQENEHHGLS